jgi:hypothetical protein
MNTNESVMLSTGVAMSTAPSSDITMDTEKMTLFHATFFYLVGVAGTVITLFGIVGNFLSIR